MAENSVRTLKVCLQQRSSKVTWNYTWNQTLVTSPWNLHLTLHLHYTFHSTIENFSACYNTSSGIKLAASKADRLRSACSLAINSSNSCFLLDICGCTGSLRIWPCFKRKYFHIRSRIKRNAILWCSCFRLAKFRASFCSQSSSPSAITDFVWLARVSKCLKLLLNDTFQKQFIISKCCCFFLSLDGFTTICSWFCEIEIATNPPCLTSQCSTRHYQRLDLL